MTISTTTMSIFVLLAVVWIALIFSNVADAISISGLIHFPRWAMWFGAIALIAWCMDSGDSSLD